MSRRPKLSPSERLVQQELAGGGPLGPQILSSVVMGVVCVAGAAYQWAMGEVALGVVLSVFGVVSLVGAYLFWRPRRPRRKPTKGLEDVFR